MPVASAAAVLLLGASLAVAAPEPLLRIQDPALLESSGLAVSALHDGVLWTHADGGSVAEVRAVDRSGATVAVVTLAGVDPYDPEALAPGRAPDGTPQLWLADIGDNLAERADVSVFRFDEPRALTDGTVTATWFRFTFPDGPHDAEALLVHPRTGRVFVATKQVSGAGLYRAPRELVPAGAGGNRLERVADVPSFVTDGTFLRDGRFVLRTYTSLYVYERPGQQVATGPLPAQPQGESIAVDGKRLLVGSEGVNSAVYAVRLPAPDPADPAVTGNPPSDESRREPWWREGRLAVRFAAAVIALVGIALLLRRRHRPRTNVVR
ncbi:MAG: hypothetical protein H0U35_07390 [Sporichthyaceae bacterium]|nr:hypothetical protein [Sporichthyaceae bacterium]